MQQHRLQQQQRQQQLLQQQAETDFSNDYLSKMMLSHSAQTKIDDFEVCLRYFHPEIHHIVNSNETV